MKDILQIVLILLVINIVLDPFSLRYIFRNKMIKYVNTIGRGKKTLYAYINFYELAIAPFKTLLVDVKSVKLMQYMITSQLVYIGYILVNLSAVIYMQQIGQMIFSTDISLLNIIMMDFIFVLVTSACLHLYVKWLYNAYQILIDRGLEKGTTIQKTR
ncbi:TPA: hypothetical protein PCY29_002732 [Staphylococcus aureus]|nr:hypothetical protein [Staphylococcus aureus]HDF4675837.1 hypothetical protein [Staphylococcus aureus]HDG2601531.1 hypothetical protein [Staphylococcus aureus]HDJ7348688.1 hypothetical protein [Staphylococcus aureus]HEA0121575.1 hypothetical protein [Staphylococcus aureus]